ncbi:MAG: MFS transporter [Deltaproteobacteria bacterium]|jgi:MFS family permease|nr:MFS transporter [Deltaproteobacteria bacterium]
MKRNVTLLALSQAILITGTSLLLSSCALVGMTLSSSKSLATLPLALLFLAQMATTIPASLYMQRVGRRPGFMTSSVFGMAGAAIATLGILKAEFGLFCFGTVCIGVFNGFGQYYRFAAAETAPEEYRSRAISYVLAGGLIAAFAGPNLAKWSRQVLPEEFAGSYAILIGIYLLALGIAVFLRLPGGGAATRATGGRPLGEVARQPAYFVAVASAMVGYGVMNFIMIATPLAMHDYAHPFSDTAFVIQWHVFGMFFPSFFTGHLIRKFGTASTILAGILLLGLCVGINFTGETVVHFWGSLIFLGVGWNFVFVGATTQLTETYTLAEKAKAQALNDFIVFGTVTLTSLSSGAVQNLLGWQTINLAVIPFLVFICLANIWLRGKQAAAVSDPSKQMINQ